MADKPRTVGDVGETGVIESIVSAAPSARNGDDAAVLAMSSPNSSVVVSTDMMIEGRHFHRHWSTPEEVGQKAVLQNFADVEAMGARPIAALLAISTPTDIPIDFITGLATGINQRAGDYAAELVGGDVTGGDHLVISVTAIGSLGGGRPGLRLDQARASQRVVAHGKIGWSAAGYALLEAYGRDGVPVEFTPLIDAHVAPRLDPGRGVIARATGATAMTDSSDGLVHDLAMIARRSGVGIDLDRTAVAPSPELVAAGRLLGVDPWWWVLTGGEDHTLLGTTHNDTPSGFRQIGRVVKGHGAVTVGGRAPDYTDGWVSF